MQVIAHVKNFTILLFNPRFVPKVLSGYRYDRLRKKARKMKKMTIAWQQVSYKMTFHHVLFYLDLVCILYPVCSLQSAVCVLYWPLPKFIQLCMETPCLCPFQGHQYGRRKPTETSVFMFSYLCVNSSLEELIKIRKDKECLDRKIYKNP